MSSANLPAAVPPEAAAAIRDTLGAAVAVSAELPGELGRIVVEGSPQGLKQELGGDVVTLALADDADDDTMRRAVEAITEFPGAGDPTVFDHSLSIQVRDAGEALSALVRRLDAAGIAVARLSMSSPTLDEVFLRHTGERMRAEDPNTRASSSTTPTVASPRAVIRPTKRSTLPAAFALW